MTDALDLDAFRAQQRRLRRLARALSGNDHDADDLAQDAWVRALERGPSDERALGAWLGTVARRISLNARRSRARARAREADAARPEALPSSAEIAARVEAEARVLRAIDSLDEPHRTVLRDRYLGDLTPDELAVRDGLTVEAVRSRLKRARAALRVRLDRTNAGGWAALAGPILGVDGARQGAAAAAVSAVGTGASAAGTSLLGGAFVMKKITIVTASIGLALFGWLALSGPGDAARTRGAAAQPLGRAVASDGDALGAPPEAAAETSLASAAGADGGEGRVAAGGRAGGGWIVEGRLRDRAGVGVVGIDLAVDMRGGLREGAPVVATFEARSDADGRFRFELARPDASVAFEVKPKPDPGLHFATGGAFAAPLGRPAPSLDVLVLRLDSVVRGTVTAPDGRPAQGVTVAGLGGRATTAPDGTYTMRVGERDGGQVDAWGPGLALASAIVDVGPGDDRVLDFALEPAHIVEGVVLDGAGAGVGGAEIGVFHHWRLRTETDAAGRFRIDSLPDRGRWPTMTVFARAQGLRARSIELDRAGGPRVHEVELRLEPGATIEGRVLEPDGTPAVGAEVWAGWARLAWDNSTAITGDDGAFTLTGVAAGRTLIGAALDGFAELEVERELKDGDDVTLTFEAARSISGRVVGPEGGAVAGVAVAARNNGAHIDARARTDAEGRFELAPLPGSGSLAVVVYGAGWVRTTRSVPEGHEGPLEIMLERAGVLAGRVVDAATGEPVESFTVVLGWPEGPVEGPPLRGVNSSWVDPGRSFEVADGRWRSGPSDEFPVGTRVRVDVQGQGYAPLRTDAVEVRSEGDGTEHRFRLRRAVDLEVRVVADGEPVVDAVVRATVSPSHDRDAPAWEARTGAAGLALLKDVAPGTLHLGVAREGAPTVRAGAHSIASGGSVVVLELPGSIPVTLRVLDHEGRPRAGVEVALVGGDASSSPGEEVQRRTDEAGAAVFHGITPGTWIATVVVQEPRTGERHRAQRDEILVEPGVPLVHVLRPPGEGVVVVELAGEFDVPDGQLAWLGTDPGERRPGIVRDGAIRFEGVPAGDHAFTLDFRLEPLHRRARVRRTLACPGGPGEHHCRITPSEDDVPP